MMQETVMEDKTGISLLDKKPGEAVTECFNQAKTM
jgi:hypothetical protein